MRHSIQSLMKQFGANTVGGGNVRALIHCQIVAMERRMAQNSKPFFDIQVSDGGGVIKLKVWSNAPAFPQCETLTAGGASGVGVFVELDGGFKHGDFGVESNDFRVLLLTDAQIAALLEGTPEQIENIAGKWAKIVSLVDSMECPVMKELSKRFLAKYEEPFKRAGAARGNHHARRGGLVEHTATMMAAADGVWFNYHLMRSDITLNRSLLLAGTLLHDCGKMIENQFEKRGFEMPFSTRAELYGHIGIGVEIVKGLARASCAEGLAKPTEALVVDAAKFEYAVDCLCHMILAHHGQLDFGSPVEPKFPEVAILHYCDQIDAKLEMMQTAYMSAKEIAPGVFERAWPMKVNLVRAAKEGF